MTPRTEVPIVVRAANFRPRTTAATKPSSFQTSAYQRKDNSWGGNLIRLALLSDRPQTMTRGPIKKIRIAITTPRIRIFCAIFDGMIGSLPISRAETNVSTATGTEREPEALAE